MQSILRILKKGPWSPKKQTKKKKKQLVKRMFLKCRIRIIYCDMDLMAAKN